MFRTTHNNQWVAPGHTAPESILPGRYFFVRHPPLFFEHRDQLPFVERLGCSLFLSHLRAHLQKAQRYVRAKKVKQETAAAWKISVSQPVVFKLALSLRGFTNERNGWVTRTVLLLALTTGTRSVYRHYRTPSYMFTHLSHPYPGFLLEPAIQEALLRRRHPGVLSLPFFAILCTSRWRATE